MAGLARELGGRLLRRLSAGDVYLVAFPEPGISTVPDSIALFASRREFVAFAEPDYVVSLAATTPNDPKWSDLWGLHDPQDNDIDAPEAWDVSTGSANVVVAVIDSGVEYDHEDLAANMWTNPGEIAGNGIDDDGNGKTDDIHGWDFREDDADPYDDHDHGTHCSGTIGAVGDNGKGVVGVSWRVSIMALRFIDSSNKGSLSDAIDAIDYATWMRTNGVNVRVSNNSWGAAGVNSSALSDAIVRAWSAGVLFVAAAGNSASDTDSTPYYPACYGMSNILAVAATDSGDNLAGFSNYGATSVDLGAPGVEIWSCDLGGNQYRDSNGTSMAAPHVVGVAALLWSVRPAATWKQVRQAILESVDPVSSLSGKTMTGGRLNAFSAVQKIMDLVPFNGAVFRVR
jgi:subtilisin family serine protease